MQNDEPTGPGSSGGPYEPPKLGRPVDEDVLRPLRILGMICAVIVVGLLLLLVGLCFSIFNDLPGVN